MGATYRNPKSPDPATEPNIIGQVSSASRSGTRPCFVLALETGRFGGARPRRTAPSNLPVSRASTKHGRVPDRLALETCPMMFGSVAGSGDFGFRYVAPIQGNGPYIRPSFR